MNVQFLSFFITPQVGLEPTTNRLTADCSTTELLRTNFIIIIFESLTTNIILGLQTVDPK